MNKKIFVCKSMTLANYLIEHGSLLKRIDKDQESKRFLVFLFEKDEKLIKNLEKWSSDKHTYIA